MIPPIRFLWKQFNGPQITAVTKGLYLFIKSQIDEKMDYFNSLTVKSVNDNHLTILGLISGILRPIVTIPSEKLFWFTRYPEHPFDHGFQDKEDPEIGGKFSGIAIDDLTEYLPEDHYRIILEVKERSNGDIGSLVLLDDIFYTLAEKYCSEPNITYSWSESQGSAHTGDVTVNLGRYTSWWEANYIQATVTGLANTSYAPVPRVFPDFSTE